MDTDVIASENTRLLDAQQRDDVQERYNAPTLDISFKVLPVPFLAAMAIAATAATEMFAYAAILCKDPRHCRDEEKTRFAGTVSVAVIIANICSLFALGPLVSISKRSRRVGLASWTVCRSMSVVALVLGVYFKSVLIVLSGRVFEGIASDNLLHFNLNAIYVQRVGHQTVARLIGASLALYMVGICLAPLIAGALPSFQTSFYFALAFFAIILAYIGFLPARSRHSKSPDKSTTVPVDAQGRDVTEHASSPTDLRRLWKTPLKPLLILKTDPIVFLPWLSLLCYNLVQSFAFAVIMTYTTLTFGFTGRENGFILSIAHAVAATYLLVNSFIIPQIRKAFANRRAADSSRRHQQGADVRPRYGLAGLAITSILLEASSLILMAFATEQWQVYSLTVLLAMGLSAPSFIKSYVTTLIPHSKAGEAIAVLTVAETSGSLLAPFVLGILLTSRPGPTVFLVASGVLCISSFALAGSTLPHWHKRN